MREEQLSERAQAEPTAQDSTTQGDVQGLPPHLYGQIRGLRPGDAAPLTILLRLHPEYSANILAAASPIVGLSTIKEAQARVGGNAEGRGSSLGSIDPGSEYLDESRDDTTEGNRARPQALAADPAFVSAARRYNSAHPHLVARFIDIIKDRSFLGPDGEIDAKKVAAFQQAQGIDADGKVGPQTIAAAQKYSDSHPKSFGLE